jgi:selenide,water dikinase
MGPGDLEKLLAKLPEEDVPELISSIHAGDNAGVYLLQDDLALVQTVDFFPPIVDDPYTFGQIAAANALSDIYAMNAKPLTALNIAAFPCDMDRGVLQAILLGGYDKVHEAGAVIAGGHTIEDDEPKYGLAVTGTVRLPDMTTIRGARPGDLLLLTKALGTGIMTTALKAGEVSDEDMSEVVASMCMLNGEAASVIFRHGVHAMTDVTGFGLAGHLYEMARASGVGADIWASKVQLFGKVLDMVAMGMAPRNSARECFEERRVEVATGGVEELLVQCVFDPQTSGGLLAAVEADKAEDILSELKSGPAPRAHIVGEVTEAETPVVTIRHAKEE